MAKIADANVELHAHILSEKIALNDIVDAMHIVGLDVVALSSYNSCYYPIVKKQVRKFYPESIIDDAGVKLPNGKYLLNAQEHSTKEGFHLLSIGYSSKDENPEMEIRMFIDECLEKKALVFFDHPFVDTIDTFTAGHISDEKEGKLRDYCIEYSGKIGLEWNTYNIHWVRQLLKYGLNMIGHKTRYHNVNERVEDLSKKLSSDGCNVPLLAATDLHARKARHLLSMGTSRLVVDLDGVFASDILASMKKNIFANDYENIKNTVPLSHLFSTYLMPISYEILGLARKVNKIFC